MKLRLTKSLVLPALLLLALSACDQGREAPEKTSVRVVNAAPGYQSLIFRREEAESQSENTPLEFRQGVEFSYDVDTYDFNVEYVPRAGGARQRLISFAQPLVAGTSYVFVITGEGSALTPVVLEYAKPAADASTAQILGLHAAASIPAVDVYLEAPGAVIAGAVPRGTLAPGAALAPATLPAGDYQITLTAAGNPADVLLRSGTFTLGAASTTAFVVAPEAGATNSAVSVLAMQSAAGALFDGNAAAAMRVINGATDQQPRDVAVDSQFAPPLFAAVPFAAETPYLPLAGGNHTVNVTPPGNPGALELNQTIAPTAPTLYTLLFTGQAGALSHVLVPHDGRRLAEEAKLRFYNVATQFTGIDVVFVNEGVDVTISQAIASLGAPGASTEIAGPPGTFSLALRQTGTANIVAGPQTITLAKGGLYGVLATNGPDTATATIQLLEDF